MKLNSILAFGLAVAGLSIGSSDSSGAVTPYSWIRLGETGSHFLDSSGNQPPHNFNAAFSSLSGGNAAVVLEPKAVGGPLGTTGASSSVSTHWGYYNLANSGMWIQGPGANGSPPTPDLFSLPLTNWVMEAWVLPEDDGASGGGTSSQFASTGSGQFGGRPGGAAFRTRFTSDELGNGVIYVRADAIGVGTVENFRIGDEVLLPTNRWTHVAVVNDNGVTTFYVNGVATGPAAPHDDIKDGEGNVIVPAVGPVSQPSGAPYIGSGQDTGSPFKGWLDEVRYSTFLPGQFAVSDLLLIPPGPKITGQPQSTTVWAGSAAPMSVTIALDDAATYQWRRGGANITGATTSSYTLNPATVGDSGAVFDVVITTGGISKTSDPATLTVVAASAPDVAAYRDSIMNTASLKAYFPADGDTGATLSNLKETSRDGTLVNNAFFDGRTNRAFGQQAVSFKGDSAVQIPNSPNTEFADGKGTIEALVYLDPAAALGVPSDNTIFAQAEEKSPIVASPQTYYAIRVANNGSALIYFTDALNENLQTVTLRWDVPGGMLGKLTHIAIVIDGLNVTAYVNGINLGTKTQAGLGSGVGQPSWIGGMGSNATVNYLYGSVDELSIFGEALTEDTIQFHFSNYYFGTHTAPPTITSQSGNRTVLAGSSPVLKAAVTGTLPIKYQWSADGTIIPGATSAIYHPAHVNATTTYVLNAKSSFGEVNSAPIVITVNPAPAGYASKVLADGPTGFWRLAETSGTVATDSSGFNDGAYQGGYTQGVPSIPTETATAARFNGSNGRVVVPWSSDINPAGPFSIELWGQLDNNNGNKVALSALDRPSRGAGYEYYMGGNFPGWEFHTGGGGNYDAIAGDANKQPVGPWWHIVGTYDGAGIKLYVNGELGSEGTAPNDPPFTANTVANLFIGSRSDNGAWWPGALANVAFYNYELTPQQVTNHFSVAWVAAAFTQQPANSAALEAANVVLSGAASGYPNKYQWYKGGVVLDGAGGKFAGFNTPNLTINNLVAGDAGDYVLKVLNPLGDLTSQTATLTVNPDLVGPKVVYVTATATPNRVRVVFDKPVTAATAEVAANYTFNGGITATEAIQSTNDMRIVNIITSAPLTAGQIYTVSVSGVRDTRANANLIAANSTGFRAYVLTTGALAMDVYNGIGGGAVADLVGHPSYPKSATTNLTLSSFSFDINGNWAETYGAHIYGWITPTVPGDYTFYIRSDDASQLWMSPDNNPVNVELIAEETGCCNGYAEGTARTSAPRTLAAGASYYVEAFLKEGGGGDYIHVAWRPPGDTTAVGSLPDVPGSVLSAYAPAPVSQLTATFTGGQVVITWTGTGKLQESTNLPTWTDVAGNPTSGYSFIPPAGAGMRFFRVFQ